MESWASVALSKDWYPPSRLMNGPSWHYVHSDQWRYERSFRDYLTVPEEQPERNIVDEHTIDSNVRAVRNGWLPFYPQFDANPIDLVAEADRAGTDPVTHVVDRLKARDLKFAIERPDAEECWPRLWFIWRGNALMSSAKGHEYFLDHYLGTHTNRISQDLAEGHALQVEWVPEAPSGKMDLVVDLNFRMDTSALYSDIVLPHPPADGGGAAVLGGEERLGHLPLDRGEVLGAGDAPPAGEDARHRRRPAGARHAGRDRAAGDPELDRRRGRGRPGQDDAGAQGGRARLPQPLPPVLLLRPRRP
jgi:hypothetical protein